MFWLDDLSSEMLEDNSDCKNQILQIESSNIDSFLQELKINYDTRLNRAILLFYIEGGEVIEFYSIAILISENNVDMAIYKDGSLMSSGESKNFTHEKFYTYLNTVEEKQIINQRKLSVFDFEKGAIECSSYSNIKRTEGDKFKKMIFGDN